MRCKKTKRSMQNCFKKICETTRPRKVNRVIDIWGLIQSVNSPDVLVMLNIFCMVNRLLLKFTHWWQWLPYKAPSAHQERTIHTLMTQQQEQFEEVQSLPGYSKYYTMMQIQSWFTFFIIIIWLPKSQLTYWNNWLSLRTQLIDLWNEVHDSHSIRV